MFSTIVHGVVLAFGLILPLGVQNVFVFNQGALQPTYVRSLPVILTAALCDTLLISLAVMGVSVLVFGIAWLKTTILSIGILFLFYMGYTTWRSEPPSNDMTEVKKFTPKKQIAFAASVSLLNPHAILDTVGVIGTSSLSYTGVNKLVFALTCIIVSWLWFFGLAFAGRIAGRIDHSGRFVIYLNKASSIIMWGTGIYLLTSLIN